MGYNYTNEIYKGTSELHKRLVEAGIVSYKSKINWMNQWLYPLERKGKLMIPRHVNNPRIRLMTEDQIKGIIKAFSPGGKGYYPNKKFK